MSYSHKITQTLHGEHVLIYHQCSRLLSANKQKKTTVSLELLGPNILSCAGSRPACIFLTGRTRPPGTAQLSSVYASRTRGSGQQVLQRLMTRNIVK